MLPHVTTVQCQEWDPATGQMVATTIEIETGDLPQARHGSTSMCSFWWVDELWWALMSFDGKDIAQQTTSTSILLHVYMQIPGSSLLMFIVFDHLWSTFFAWFLAISSHLFWFLLIATACQAAPAPVPVPCPPQEVKVWISRYLKIRGSCWSCLTMLDTSIGKDGIATCSTYPTMASCTYTMPFYNIRFQ